MYLQDDIMQVQTIHNQFLSRFNIMDELINQIVDTIIANPANLSDNEVQHSLS